VTSLGDGPDGPDGVARTDGAAPERERPATMAPAQVFLIAITALAVGFAALMAFLMYWVVPALAS
jgi:hypothetical protein